MKKIKEIAYELLQGNVEKAAQLKLNSHFADPALEMEVVEIAKQAIISYLKKGDVEKAFKTKKFFSIPQEEVEGALKQAILSSYFDGDLKRVLDIRHKMPMSLEFRQEVIDYCDSWGRHHEAEVMKNLLLDAKE